MSVYRLAEILSTPLHNNLLAQGLMRVPSNILLQIHLSNTHKSDARRKQLVLLFLFISSPYA